VRNLFIRKFKLVKNNSLHGAGSSWAASNHSCDQDTPWLFMEWRVSLQCSQGPTAEPNEFCPTSSDAISWKSSLIFSSYLCPWSHYVKFFNPSHFLYIPYICGFCLSHPLDSISLVIFSVEYVLRSSSLCSFLHSLVTCSLLDPSILFCILFSNTLKLLVCSAHNVWYSASHPSAQINYSSARRPKILDWVMASMLQV
jgi:hypothetical protein